ncbi:MAG: AsmA family protein [Betaproteobacteria bacterium]|nr:AsmA family protein [Betaproteobacteria bacterium]
MKTLKYLAIALGVLILIVVVGVGIFAATFDPNKYKDEITRVVKEKKDRTLAIPGNIKLAFFPKLGVETGEASLSEYKSGKQFLKVGKARLYLDIFPLLRKELVIDKVEVDGLEANVVKQRDGKFNFDDLLTKDEKKDDQEMVKFDAQGFTLNYANISYTDEASGQTAKISGLGLETGRLANGVPSKFTMAANLEGEKPLIKAQLRLVGELTFDLNAKIYSVKGLDGKINGNGLDFSNAALSLKGAVQSDTARKSLDASGLELEFTGGYRQVGVDGKPTLEVTGADIKLGADTLKLNTETLEVAGTKFSLSGNGSYNQEPFDVKVMAPTLAADGRKKALRGEQIKVEAKGRRGQQSGTVTLEVAKVDADLSAHRIALEGMTAGGSGAMPGMLLNDFKAKVPKLQVDLSADQILVDGVTVSANGKKGDDDFDLKVDAPRLSVSKDNAAGEAVTGAVKMSGKDALDMKFSLSDVKGSGKALSVGKVALEIARAQFGETSVSGGFYTALTANLEGKVFELAKIDANLTVANPQMPMKSVKLPIAGSARADLGRETAAADLSIHFDESTITAKGGVTKFSGPAINFDVNIDKLNVDKYFPPKPAGPKSNEPEKPIDLSALKALNATGTLKIGALQVNNIKASNVVLNFKANGGKVDLNPMSAALYQGTMKGSVALDANQNSFVVKQNLAGVNINPLMKDAIDKDILEGRGTVNLDLTTAGNTPSALKRALNGSAAIDLKDGAYKGINLAKSFRELKAGVSLDKTRVQDAKKGDKTDFTEMKISAQIKNGVAESSDLDARSPFLRLGGAGKVDIGASTLDYVAKAAIVNTSGGQQGKELAQLNGLTVPVKLTGPLEAVKYNIDYGEIAKSLATSQLKGKAEDLLKNKLGIGKPEAAAPAQGGQAQQQKPADKLKDRLKGLIH